MKVRTPEHIRHGTKYLWSEIPASTWILICIAVLTAQVGNVHAITFFDEVNVSSSSASDITVGGAATHSIEVTWSAAVEAILASSISPGDITVTGPSGLLTITGVSKSPNFDAPFLTATYTFSAPGGTWDAADNGVYTCSTVAHEVMAGPAGGPYGDNMVSVALQGFTVAITDPRIYVDTDATGANNGTSWTHAFVDLQDALASVSSSNQIWIADGIYYPDEASAGVAVGITNNEQNLSFQLVDGVEIYGGFAGNEAVLEQRNLAANVTVLSGDIDQNDITNADGVITNDPNGSMIGSNSFNVVRSTAIGPGTLLDGLTITAGKASGGGNPRDGACLNTSNGDLQVRNCTFSGGHAVYNAGGVSVTGGTVVFSNCVFTAHWAVRGGAISANGTILTILDSVFTENICDYAGAGIFCIATEAVFERCVFTDNNASRGGGYGADNFNPSIRFRDCLFADNLARSNGGGLQLWTGSNEVVNCTIVGNHASDAGGGIYAKDGVLDIRNSIIWHNSTDANGLPDSAASIFNTNSVTRIAYSAVEHSGSNGSWTSAIGSDEGGNLPPNPPLLIDVGSANDRLQFSSPCINAGTNLAWVAGAVDLDGNTRLYDGTVDMGAYEAYDDGSDSDNDGLTGWDEGRLYGTDPNDAYSDNDTQNDGDEIIAGTDPLNSASLFAVGAFNVLGAGTNEISWESVSNRLYWVERSYDLQDSNAWVEVWGPVWQPSPMVFTNNSKTNAAAFYRLRVE